MYTEHADRSEYEGRVRLLAFQVQSLLEYQEYACDRSINKSLHLGPSITL